MLGTLTTNSALGFSAKAFMLVDRFWVNNFHLNGFLLNEGYSTGDAMSGGRCSLSNGLPSCLLAS